VQVQEVEALAKNESLSGRSLGGCSSGVNTQTTMVPRLAGTCSLAVLCERINFKSITVSDRANERKPNRSLPVQLLRCSILGVALLFVSALLNATSR